MMTRARDDSRARKGEEIRMKYLVAGAAALVGLTAGPALADAHADLVARGQYLVEGPMGCGNCHAAAGPMGPQPETPLVGRLVEDNAAFTAYAPNLTPASHIADWTDAELARAIREGIRPDGSVIGMPMPFSAYRGISDDDLAAIVAYLRTRAPVENDLPKSEYRIPLPPTYGPPIETVAAKAPGATAEYGEYVALTLAHCMECHSTMTPMGPDYTPGKGLGAGGFEFHGPWGTSVAANVTSGEDGIGAYSDAELKAMIVSGTRADGAPMMPPMPYPYLARMTGEDLDAVVAYLRALPAVEGH
jgi:mono/diheme cytochrome c family protein